MKKHHYHPVLLTASLLTASSALADDISQSGNAASVDQEVIITANRMQQLRHETLTASTIISEEQIALRQPASLFELLAATPGIQTTRTGSEGAQTSLFLRGANSDHTLILLDGMKINTASEGFARLEHIPVEQIERIEIARGPQSSVHGADALGGVIQIFTRHADSATDQPRLRGQVSAGAGTENSYRGQARLDFQQGGTAASLGMSHRQTDGIRPRNAPTPSEQRSNYDSDSLNLSMSHRFAGDQTLRASWNRSESSLLYDGGETDARSDNFRLGGDFDASDFWHVNLQAGYFRDDNRTYSFSDSRSTTRRHSVKWQNHLRPADGSDLLLGLDHDREELLYLDDSAVQSDTKRDSSALFAVYDRSFGVVDSTVSLRHDNNEQYGGKTTGRLALGRDAGERMRVWAAYGTAFKAPDLINLYVDFPAFNFFANPDLEPETAKTVEAGVRGNQGNIDWSTTVFRNEISKLIASDATFTSLTNIDRVRIHGAELTLHTELLGWQADASLTLLDHEDRETGEALLRRPDELLSLGLNRQFGSLRTHLHWTVRGAQADLDPVTFGRSEVAGSGVVDLALSWQAQSNFQLDLKLGNILDKTYQVVDGFNTYGFTAHLGGSYRF